MPYGNAPFPRSLWAMSENLKSCNPQGTCPHKRRTHQYRRRGLYSQRTFPFVVLRCLPFGGTTARSRRSHDIRGIDRRNSGIQPAPNTWLPLYRHCSGGRGWPWCHCILIGYVLPIRPPSTYIKNVPPRALEPGAQFSFELTGTCGAALATKHLTYREDSILETAFEGYTKRHYDSWVTFARDKLYGNNVQPVLVYGFDMTKDFAMVAYSNEGASLESDLTVAVPMVASASAAFWGSWHTRCSPHTNFGPQECSPPPPEDAVDPRVRPKSAPKEFNQCVFIRYYTMRSKKWKFPKVIRAGAGPHDLGSGDNGGGTFPELASQSDTEPATSSDDSDLGGEGDLAAGADLGPSVVIRNTPYVWFSSCPFIPTLTSPCRMRSTIAGVSSRTTYSR